MVFEVLLVVALSGYSLEMLCLRKTLLCFGPSGVRFVLFWAVSSFYPALCQRTRMDVSFEQMPSSLMYQNKLQSVILCVLQLRASSEPVHGSFSWFSFEQPPITFTKTFPRCTIVSTWPRWGAGLPPVALYGSIHPLLRHAVEACRGSLPLCFRSVCVRAAAVELMKL